MLFFLGWMPFLAIVAIFILGTLIYFKFGKNVTRTGVLRNYGHRPALYLFYTKKGRRKRQDSFRKKTNTTNLDGALASKAGVVVPLLGNEHSAEMLIEIGAAINKKEKVQAVNITEIPNQAYLEAFMDESPKITALERRISRLATSRNIDIDFEAVVTHDLTDTIHQLSDQTCCDWLVMGWNGKAHNGILVSNPVGWLVTHINSDFALFKDNGVRYIGKVLLALRPGGKDKNFLAVADRICAFYNASLSLLHVIPEDTSKEDIQKMEENATHLLRKTTVKNDFVIIKNNNSIEAISEISAGYDLLILGTPQKDNWLRVLFGAKDKFTEKSACSVLRLTVKE